VGKGNKRFRTSNRAFGEKLRIRSLNKLLSVNSLTASAPKTLAVIGKKTTSNKNNKFEPQIKRAFLKE
jgi:hypothetical protein